jgi:hypothetical protein
MPNITDFLCAIERRAERAVIHELRLMTNEILAMRTHLTLQHRAHADALLMRLDHLERCQQVEPLAPAAVSAVANATGAAITSLRFEPIGPQPPSHFLVYFYSHEAGDLERVDLTETLAGAAQLVHRHVTEGARPLSLMTHCTTSGELAFLTGAEMVLARIVPCDPSSPEVEPMLAEACTALVDGDCEPLCRLFVPAVTPHAEPLAA